MKILTFDTETTGFAPKGSNWETDFARFPYIASIAWRLSDDANNTLIEHNHFIRPDGWTMPADAAAVNGLSDEFLKEKGGDAKTILRHFMLDAMQSDRLVAHNIYFDTSIIKANLLRLGVNKESFNDYLGKEKRFCTMQKSIAIINGSHGGGNKWPKLIEIYRHLFQEGFDGAHDALNDVRACSRVYYELVRRGVN